MNPVKWMVESARSWNHSMLVAKSFGDLPATVAAMRDRRNNYMAQARKYAA